MKCLRFDGFGKLKFEVMNYIDVYQTVTYQPGALIWGGQLSGSVSNPF